MAETKRVLMQGNQACVHGAIYAGMRFYGGYPITPSTEVAEGCARELPKIGGRFIQMEDEIGSIAAVIGASVAGMKSMTATSGPGYSLMLENIGYAYMTETPCVIINVQRGGPSTGLPTKTEQSDLKFAIYGTSGEAPRIILAPTTVEDCFYQTIRAFNLAEMMQAPVIVMTDQSIGYRKATVRLPDFSGIDEIKNYKEKEGSSIQI